MKLNGKIASLALLGAMANILPAAGESASGWEFTPAEGVSYDEQPVFTAEASMNFHSRYMTYGVIDGKDPIVVPSVCGTFFDWAYIGTDFICDTTKGNAKGFGYGNRAGLFSAIDAYVGLAHEFDINETVGALSLDFGYMYEYATRTWDMPMDMQYLYLELSLGDMPFEPTLYVERELMYDDGTYASLEIGHTFEISDVFSVRPSVSQGIGNSLRTKGYFGELDSVYGFDHAGLMDTCVKLEFEYCLTDWCTLGAYVAYYDYLLDGNMREAARAYNSQWGNGCDYSWSFVGGMSVTMTF